MLTGVSRYKKLFKLKHGNRYQYDWGSYKNNKSNMTIICAVHGPFAQMPGNHKDGSGCPECAKDSARIRAKTQDQFLAELNSIYTDGRLDFSKVEYVNDSTKVLVTCKEHGDWWTTPRRLLIGMNCPQCKKRVHVEVKRGGAAPLTTEEFIRRAREKHEDMYDYSPTQYVSKRQKVAISCPQHGVFYQLPTNHLAGKGCNKCRIYRITFTKNTVIARFRAVHGERYNYDKVKYINGDTPVVIACEKHGDFEQTPYFHAKGNGCPSCSTRVSQPETDIYNHLVVDYSGEVIRNTRSVVKGYELDLYLPDLKLAIEYCGLYWHSETNIGKFYHRDKLRACRAAGVRLITIFEDEWLDRSEVIKSKLAYETRSSTVRQVYARKCQVVELDPKTKNEYMDQWHLQGKDNCAKSYALTYDEEVVCILTMARPSISGGMRHVEWNVSRFVSRPYVSVVGGFSRLLKHFIREENPKSISTYADLRWSEGKLYSSNGFTHTHDTKPNYWYFRNFKRYHRYSFRKHELERKLKYYDKTKTEYANMLANLANGTGMDRIWDCGNASYVWCT